MPSKANEIPVRPRLIFSFNCAENSGYAQQLRHEFERYPELRQMFAGLEVRFCNLSPERDVYIRNSKELGSPYGNKAGPNWLFYETMKALRPDCDFVLLMETDCQPIAPHWLQRLEKLCVQNEDAWVVGSHYRGASPLHWTLARHINGNALYHVGDPAFWQFLDGVLWPWMQKHIREVDADLAYDCAWETFLHRPEMQDPAHYDWMVSRGIFDRFRICNAIVNLAGFAEQRGDYIWTRKDVLQRFPGAVMVHGPLAQSSTHIRNGIALGRITTIGDAEFSAGSEELVGLLPKSTIERAVWSPGLGVAPGMSLKVSVAFTCPAKTGLRLELRDPNGKLLASARNMHRPEKEELWVGLTHTFNTSHSFVRIGFRHHGQVATTEPVKIKRAVVDFMQGEKTVKIKDLLSQAPTQGS